MNVDNPLSREFLLRYPVESARVLEQVSAEHVAALLDVMPSAVVAPVVVAMLPETAAACLALMDARLSAKLLAELPALTAAHVYRLLTAVKRDELSGFLSDKTQTQLRRRLKFRSASAGALLDLGIDRLPDNITVAEAIRRIERLGHPVNCEIYIIDDAHHLVGIVELGRLLASNHDVRIRDIMNRKLQTVSVHATAESLLLHPAWATRHRLPAVERDNSLVGVLDYNCLREALGDGGATAARDPMENLISLAGLYWLSMAQLLDSLLSIAGPRKGERQ